MEIPWTGFFALPKAAEKECNEMKKRVLKRKKNIIVYKQRTNAGKAIVLAAAVCLFLTAAVPVCGKEPGISSSQQAPKRGITEIHHRHIGNASESGGCYNTPIFRKWCLTSIRAVKAKVQDAMWCRLHTNILEMK